MVERVRQKLAGWKASQLSLAARATLVQAVTSTISSYVMQTTKIPEITLQAIDRCNRRFLWGGDEDKQKLSLVAWDDVSQRKENGGIGLRKMTHLNTALLAKLGWRLYSEPQSLWEIGRAHV